MWEQLPLRGSLRYRVTPFAGIISPLGRYLEVGDRV
jgi:hypothetical protein